MNTFNKYLVCLDTFRNISIDELNKLHTNKKIQFTCTQVDNKQVYISPLENSLFSEIEISYDKNANKPQLTYHSQLDTEDKKNDIDNFLKELYAESGKEFTEIKSQDEFVKDNNVIWAYTFENNKISVGV